MNSTTQTYTVITGASSGIGYEAAKIFAARRKNLILVARRKERLDELKQFILKHCAGLDVIVIEKDLSITENVYHLFKSLDHYQIETWINNAGFGIYADIEKQNLQTVEKMLRLNIEALTILSSLYAQKYSQTEGAQLINVSSAGGYTIVPNAITYCATKFFVSAFTEGLAQELQNAGAKLTAKVLAPAATQTEFGKVANQVDHYDYDKVFARYHTSSQMAEYLVQLYDSNKTVGRVDRETFEFKLTDPVFPYANKASHNQKIS